MIEIANLNFKYRKQPYLFNNLTFTEGAGRILGLLGKNGAGKSTLLKLITGTIAAPANSVLVMGEIPRKRHPAFLEEVYFVPETYSLPALKINEFVKAYAPFYQRFDHERLKSILADFELDSASKLSKLSYGQGKKFIIAFALATNCKLLVFDEPTNGLDIPSKAAFRKVVAGSLSEDQLVIISTHQVKDVENLIDTITVIDQGKIRLHQSVWDIANKFAFTTVSQLEGTGALYNEIAPGGYKIIKAANGSATEIDIELLFNATIQGITIN